MQDDKTRLIWSAGIPQPIPRTERSVQAKIARKVHAARGQKNKLDGLYEVLAPRSTVGKVIPTTSEIEEPNKPEKRVCNSDIAKYWNKT